MFSLVINDFENRGLLNSNFLSCHFLDLRGKILISKHAYLVGNLLLERILYNSFFSKINGFKKNGKNLISTPFYPYITPSFQYHSDNIQQKKNSTINFFLK